jgi:hypothetical protein
MPASPRLVRPWPPGEMTCTAGEFLRRGIPDPALVCKVPATTLWVERERGQF